MAMTSYAPDAPDTPKHITFHFRAGSAYLERDYMSNASSISSLDAILSRSSFIEKTDSLIVSAGASPDGNWAYNNSLAQNRAEAIKTYIAESCPTLMRDKIKTSSNVSQWAELIPLVEADMDSPYKTAILTILSRKGTYAATEKQLRQLAGGKAWNYITTNYLPGFRSGNANIVFYIEGKVITLEEAVSIPEINFNQQDTVAEETPIVPFVPLHVEPAPVETPLLIEQPTITVQPTRPFNPFIAVKTDLMLWGGVLPNFRIGTWTPNLSVEVYFARRWSAQLGWAYSNWNSYAGNKRLSAVSAFDFEGRCWLKPDASYNGFFTSLYLQFGDYDWQAETTGQTGTLWGAGVGAGYLVPLSKHWGLEAQLRLGCRSAANELYDIEAGHNYFDRKQTDGVFNAQVRLQVVYRFGTQNK